MKMPLAAVLQLPPGWVATAFPSAIELELQQPGGQRKRAIIPLPYSHQSDEWWKEQAAQAIKDLP